MLELLAWLLSEEPFEALEETEESLVPAAGFCLIGRFSSSGIPINKKVKLLIKLIF